MTSLPIRIIAASAFLAAPSVYAEVVAPMPTDTHYGSQFLKNRYLTIDPLAQGENTGKTFGIRVTLAESLQFEQAVGTTWWVDAPDDNCIAYLVDTIEVDVWDACPELHITGCGVVPVSSYHLVSVDGDGVSPTFLESATILKPGVKMWGDTVGSFDPGVPWWTPPQGTAGIDDTVAIIKTFQDPNGNSAVPIPVADMHPRVPNKVVSIDDVFADILGFQGNPYHFGCPHDPCWDNLATPCP